MFSEKCRAKFWKTSGIGKEGEYVLGGIEADNRLFKAAGAIRP
jgi:hypothetical protein